MPGAVGAGLSEETGGLASRAVLAAEECNGEGLKRLFARLPKKPDNDAIAYVQSEVEISEIWAQLEKTGVAVVEYMPGKFRMHLPDGTIVVKYGSHTDDTLTLGFKVKDISEAVKIHIKTK